MRPQFHCWKSSAISRASSGTFPLPHEVREEEEEEAGSMYWTIDLYRRCIHQDTVIGLACSSACRKYKFRPLCVLPTCCYIAEIAALAAKKGKGIGVYFFFFSRSSSTQIHLSGSFSRVWPADLEKLLICLCQPSPAQCLIEPV